MGDLYWIITVGSLSNLFSIAAFLSIVVLALFIIKHEINKAEDMDCNILNNNRKTIKMFSILTVMLSLLATFVPTKKEMLTIYGIGGTIDYIKSNDTAKQLPDKCINALDKWVDSYVKEENK